MKDYGLSTYGDRIADVYDEHYRDMPDVSPMVTTLVELAGDGPALELGIGTGRVALPLMAKGVEVHGIDASKAMIARLRAKDGGKAVPVTLGDFADVGVDGWFSLVFVVFNTFFSLLTQEDQVRCFRNVAGHLTDDGVFVIEAFVPDVTRFAHGQTTHTSQIETDRIMLDVSRHDRMNQRFAVQHVFLSEKGVQMYPVQMRYAWPSELDLMARLAGLRLRHRWSDWQRSSFTSQSTGHVSVYESTG